MAEEMTVTTYIGGEHISKRRRREHITAPQDGGGETRARVVREHIYYIVREHIYYI
jgi:hypothetical protein